jgi:hypothetical protein
VANLAVEVAVQLAKPTGVVVQKRRQEKKLASVGLGGCRQSRDRHAAANADYPAFRLSVVLLHGTSAAAGLAIMSG